MEFLFRKRATPLYFEKRRQNNSTHKESKRKETFRLFYIIQNYEMCGSCDTMFKGALLYKRIAVKSIDICMYI